MIYIVSNHASFLVKLGFISCVRARAGGGELVRQSALSLHKEPCATVSKRRALKLNLLIVCFWKSIMILCTLIVLFALPGLETLVLTQEKAMSVKPGENVKISCSTGASQDWILAWYKQKPGQAPTFLLADSTRATGLPSRFTYSGSGSQEYLNINGIQAEDEAVYYCACHGCEGSGNTYSTQTLCYTAVYGRGTEVTFATPSPPSLVLLAPPQSVSSGDEVRLVCLAQGFSPDSATLSWSDNGNAVAGPEVQTSPSQRQSDFTFIQSSTLKLGSERWNSGRIYTCHLNHPALSAPESQSASAEKCS